ncbi:MAG TPA: hypothetical protein VF338_03040 [Leptolinea sp.]
MKNLPIFILVIIVAAGCANLPFQIPGITLPTVTTPTLAATIAGAKTQSTQSLQTTITPIPTAFIFPKVDPEKTVSLFLDGQKAGATYVLTSNLLSAGFSAKIKDDAGLAAILGTPTKITEYKIGSPSYSGDSLKSTLVTTIFMPQPSNTSFTLVIENGEWKIDEITVQSAAGDYPTTPEGVVQAFLTSYQEAPDRMSNFLIPTRRAQQPPGGASGMLQIIGGLEGMVIQSAAVSPEPPTAAITVLIRAGGIDYPRKFLLTKDNSGWGIDAIEILTK